MRKISAVAFVVVAFALLLTVTARPDGAMAQTGDYDVDNDGLIEITYLEQLDAIRWDMNGDGVADGGVGAVEGYRAAFPRAIVGMGCPQSVCMGYELARSLDFDDAASYASGRVNPNWTSGVGWKPISVRQFQYFTAVFEGNDYTIFNLFINLSKLTYYSIIGGLFGWNSGDIRNMGLVDVDVTARNDVGGLVGINGNDGNITSIYITGNVSGKSRVGGLVGTNRGRITSSYAAGSTSGINSTTGGLVGLNRGNIVTSYATGNVMGNIFVGGLVGCNDGSIATIYSTGNVRGNTDVGGLVGVHNGSITIGYSISSVSGNEGSTRIGGLVGYNKSSITASYSIGSVSGSTSIGGLIGEQNERGSITDSYWNTETSRQSSGVGTGSANGVEGKTTAELQAPTSYTGIYALWHLDFDNADGDSDPTTGRDDFWDFGTSSQYPALKVDFNRDGMATWQEFGNQHDRSMPVVAPTPTYTPILTPTPAAGHDVLNRLSALEGIVETLQNRLSASEDAVAALQNRVTALEGGTPRPIATPTVTPTPRPGEPTPTPAPPVTPGPPAELSPRAQEIDAAVKAYLDDTGEPATDTEIVAACRHLRDSHWDFFGLPLATPDRDYSIAAAIFLNTNGAFEMQMYCDEKQGI